MNIFDPIEQQASGNPHSPALVAGPMLLSYQRLLEFTAATANRLRAAGVGPGDVVLIRNRTPVANLLLALAIARLGGLSGHAPEGDGLADAVRRFGAKAVVGAADLLPTGESRGQLIVLNEQELLAPPTPELARWTTHGAGDEVPWRIAPSSGTSGTFKGCLWTHGASLRNLDHAMKPTAPLAQGDRLLCFQSVATNFGLHFSIWTLSAGATLVLPKTWDLAELALCLDINGPTVAVLPAGLAVSLSDVLERRGPVQGYRFPSLRHLVVGGEALTPRVRRALRDFVCPSVVVNYGSSEAGLMATADTAFFDAHPHASSRLLPGTQVQVLGPDGSALMPGRTGLLRIRVPGMASGYVGDDAQPAAAFQDGWYVSGDRGSVSADGVLTLGVRESELLRLGGIAIDPLPIESVVNNQAPVRESALCLVATPDGGEALACIYAATAELDGPAVTQLCRQALGEGPLPSLWWQVGELPRGRSGKLSRHELGRRFKAGHDGTLTVIGA